MPSYQLARLDQPELEISASFLITGKEACMYYAYEVDIYHNFRDVASAYRVQKLQSLIPERTTVAPSLRGLAFSISIVDGKS